MSHCPRVTTVSSGGEGRGGRKGEGEMFISELRRMTGEWRVVVWWSATMTVKTGAGPGRDRDRGLISQNYTFQQRKQRRVEKYHVDVD